ncbi:MAG TPA: hypothetical protein VK177_03275 [Flavobacteriales bacterium]|nr:hypothetical protein [Flavobacteriales bacterium]
MQKLKYKIQIEHELYRKGWELIELGSGNEWWDDEHWKIQHKHYPGIFVYVCFIVDALNEPNSKAGKIIGEVQATTEFPATWNDDSTKITSICMRKEHFGAKLTKFIQELDAYLAKI